MKKLLYPLVAGIILLPSISCQKKQDTPSAQATHITLRPGDTYQLSLGSFGDEEGVTITQQATHYSVSETKRTLSTGQVVYYYRPTPGYTGSDEVSLQSARGSDGASPNNKIQVTNLVFDITD
jgi:hypothetical protein